MSLRKKVQIFNKIIKTYKMKVNQKGMDALHRPSFFQCADELKALTPGISIAVEFDGKGREIDNIKGATGLGLIDFDELDRK